jgi:hypothetical protein
MPCFYYSPNANASTKPENIQFTEAELGAHVLRMCPIQWQNQYNMNEKGTTWMDMRLLLTLLEVIKRVCTYKKGKSDSFDKSDKSSNKGEKKGRNALVPILWRPGFPRKSALRSIATYARSMGAHIPRTTLVIVVGLRRPERRNPVSVPPRKADIRVIL